MGNIIGFANNGEVNAIKVANEIKSEITANINTNLTAQIAEKIDTIVKIAILDNFKLPEIKITWHGVGILFASVCLISAVTTSAIQYWRDMSFHVSQDRFVKMLVESILTSQAHKKSRSFSQIPCNCQRSYSQSICRRK
jgi:hypothetical protein